MQPEQTIDRAKELEDRYEWLSAAEFYGKSLGSLSEQDPSRAEIHEQRAYAWHLAALQAETTDELKDRMAKAISHYEESIRVYSPERIGRVQRCKAMVSFSGFWLATKVSEKKKMVEEAWTFAKNSLEAFQEESDVLSFGQTYNNLVLSALFHYNYQWNSRVGELVLREGHDYGERAIRLLSGAGNNRELARSYVTVAAFAQAIGYLFLQDPDEQKESHQKAAVYWKKALQLSEKAALLQFPVGSPDIGLGSEESLSILTRALAYAEETRDRYLVGSFHEALSVQKSWKALGTEDPDEAEILLEEALQCAINANDQYARVQFTGAGPAVLWAAAPYADYYRLLARFETDLERRRALLKKSLNAAPDGLKRAKESGIPFAVSTALHVFSTALISLATIEARPDIKKKLLEEALQHTNEYNGYVEQLEPFNYLNQASGQSNLAQIKSQLERHEKSPADRQRLLQDAVSAQETSLRLSQKAMQWIEESGSAGMIAQVAIRQYEYGELISRLYEHAKQNELLKKGAEAFEEAAKLNEKSGMGSRIAECYWKSAQAYDILANYSKSSQHFLRASKNYHIAASKVPQLNSLYQDHATYMEAWSQIEEGRDHHARQEYGIAREHYEKTASLHASTQRWSYLAPNYSAWAQLENAEELSRMEKSQEAIQIFEEASELFRNARAEIRKSFDRTLIPEEQQLARELAKASEQREQYCTGRVVLEEAKVLEKSGDHQSSSQKYADATEAFERIAQRLETEPARRELTLIITLSKAWRAMAEAEADASPSKYLEASRLFDQAKEFAANEKMRELALGHSRFCRALDAGIRFEDSKDPTLHSTAIDNLETAARYYAKAGYQNASDHAHATKLLFDAYSYLDEATREKNQERRARLYLMAEKILETSARHFAMADHQEKREQVRRLLERARKERQLALSLTEILQAPLILSTTSSFTTPTPSHERAVGIERFEHADLQVRLNVLRKTLKVGDDLEVELEITNAGRGVAQLVRVDDLLHREFDVKEKPSAYLVDANHLNMRGKRLDPLNTEELRLVLKPNVAGRFNLKPRVLYLDESGKYKSHESEPIEIIVNEPEGFGFETERAGEAFTSLETNRRLAAIMFTDIVGYTALSQRDEALALRLLEEHRSLLRPFFPKHNGKEVKTMGDAFLVEFVSALEAARCALDIQQKLHESNLALPPEKRVALRIGVHLGDVIHTEDGDVQGDAVNVASRIEPLADPGGICVSDQVYVQVKNKIEYPFIKIGSRQLKNVQEPMEVYRVVLPWKEEVSERDRARTKRRGRSPSPT